MRPLDTKLLRDLRQLQTQALAIALVVAGGVAAILLAVGSYRSLEETRIAYYERYLFADLLATVSRAPKALAGRISEIPDAAAVDTRITKLALLDIPGVREPATGRTVSGACFRVHDCRQSVCGILTLDSGSGSGVYD